MTRREIIKAIETCYTVGHNCTECPLFAEDDCNDKLMRDALELLKEQEPKLVRYTASTVRCPNCNKQITTKGCIHREINYCWKCGQAVKWND